MAVMGLGLGLLAAMVLRLAWLRLRLPRPGLQEDASDAGPLPRASTWLWAALAAGLPLALPFAARSAASAGGEGALAVFNYAWKLVELPLMLAVQLVATLAFPNIARAFAAESRVRSDKTDAAVRPAFALAWTLACAAAAGLLLAAPAIARVLFGWGRMNAEAIARVAEWGRVGAWGLLPQAVIAVALTVLAAQRRMHGAVIAYGAALVLLLASAAAGVHDGAALMLLMNILLAGVATTLAATSPAIRSALPWRDMILPVALLVLVAFVSRASQWLSLADAFAQIAAAAVAACALIAASAWASADLRAALRR
jgi:peptidoglycan biosynthesis protein MviN/MurJ (putative lipid II flippase)